MILKYNIKKTKHLAISIKKKYNTSPTFRQLNKFWQKGFDNRLKEAIMKLKTKRGAAKRFKKTANGFKRKQAFKRHILTKKSPKRIRQLRGCVMVHVADVAAVRRMCPYI